MSSPWLKKNPFMSMWLSGANRVASSVRGQVAAEAKRQGAKATRQATDEILKIWTGAASAAISRKKARK